MAMVSDERLRGLAQALGADPEGLRAPVEALLTEGAAGLEGVQVPVEAVLVRLAAVLRDEPDPGAALRDTRAVDLCLAAACGEGAPGALAHFDALYGADLARVHRKVGARGIGLDDFVQTVTAKLFAGPGARIAEYRGRGDLRAWLRVVATRTLLDMSRPAHLRETPTTDGAFHTVASPATTPDLAYLKRLYGEHVTLAIEEAARALSPESRNVLRDTYHRGLGIDAIALAHGIHRATAARRVQRARDALFAGVRRVLRERLGLDEAELDSVLRLAESQVHVTLGRIFDEPGGA